MCDCDAFWQLGYFPKLRIFLPRLELSPLRLSVCTNRDASTTYSPLPPPPFPSTSSSSPPPYIRNTPQHLRGSLSGDCSISFLPRSYPPIKLPLTLPLTSLSLPQGSAFTGNRRAPPADPPPPLGSKWSHCLYGLFLLSNFTRPGLFTSSGGHRKPRCPFPSLSSPLILLFLPLSSRRLHPASSFAAEIKAKLTSPVFNECD